MKRKIIIGLCLLLVAFIAWRIYQFNQLEAKLPSRKSLIEKELERRLEAYSKKVTKNCVDGFLEEAQRLADSVVFIRANELMLFDTLTRPTKPAKPILPAIKPLKDSVSVQPLLLDTVSLDQEF